MPDDTYVDLSRLCMEIQMAAMQVRRTADHPDRQRLYLEALRGSVGALNTLLAPVPGAVPVPEAVPSCS